MKEFKQLEFQFGEVVTSAKVVAITPEVERVTRHSINSALCGFDNLAELDRALMRQGITFEVIDPCKECDLAAVCGHDDCAQHLYAVDVKTAPTGSFDAYFKKMENRIRKSIFK